MSAGCERCTSPDAHHVLTAAGMLRLCKACADAWWATFLTRPR